MNVYLGQNPFFEKALQEHRWLEHAVHEAQRLLQEPADQRTAAQLRAAYEQLAVLALRLKEHFAQEEEGGYLEEAASILPRLGPQVQRLEREHAPLLRHALAIAELARRAAEGTVTRAALSAAFGQFARELEAHEQAEDCLVQEAASRDMGFDD